MSTENQSTPSRDQLAEAYLESLPFPPYPVQEEALLAWFTSDHGVLVCAPTGTGKTVIAEAAMFEALHCGQVAYYTTPLIALTEQKFQELQAKAVQWGFSPDDVGLVTGNRRVNPQAKLLVVVAEILFNRLLKPDQFEFDNVASVVMDEFHSFSDPERGVVWELTLGLLPKHVRLLLLSATVGNAYEFSSWLRTTHQRDLQLVQSDVRRVPLQYEWVGDEMLTDHMERMAAGDEQTRRTPALVFCFNRDECWSVAEQLIGKRLLQPDQRDRLLKAVERYDWSHGAGPKLKTLVQRGVGVHHAGVLAKYRRIVEELYQQKLLSVTVCTETLSAGINLPARSVVLPSLMKGKPEDRKLVPSTTAHQIFGRAGRPQFDDRGYIYALAHEDDVRLARWKEKYDQIPEDTKDPGLLKAKKALKKKMPKRRTGFQYWNEQHLAQLQSAAPAKLYSKGPLPWRILAHLLSASPDVELIRQLVSKRLMDAGRLAAGQRQLDRMLMVLWRAGYVELEPRPTEEAKPSADLDPPAPITASAEDESKDARPAFGAGIVLFGQSLDSSPAKPSSKNPSATDTNKAVSKVTPAESAEVTEYSPRYARPTETMKRLDVFRGVNPLYGAFLVNQLGGADDTERLQALESILEMPIPVARFLRVPWPREMPPGLLAQSRLDSQLLRMGLVTLEQLRAGTDEDEQQDQYIPPEERIYPVPFAEKLKLLFDHDFPGVHDVTITPVWAAGSLLECGGDFDLLIKSKRLQKQEGIVFRHFLRLILLISEFRCLTPPDCTVEEWCGMLDGLAEKLTTSCRAVDATSTEKTLEQAKHAGEEF
jgi:superfamily II DNA/RNA helicase